MLAINTALEPAHGVCHTHRMQIRPCHADLRLVPCTGLIFILQHRTDAALLTMIDCH